jgi:hypothetical protein
MRKCTNILTIYEEVISHITLLTRSQIFQIYEENFLFFFISVAEHFVCEETESTGKCYLANLPGQEGDQPIHGGVRLAGHNIWTKNRGRLQVETLYTVKKEVKTYFTEFYAVVDIEKLLISKVDQKKIMSVDGLFALAFENS